MASSTDTRKIAPHVTGQLRLPAAVSFQSAALPTELPGLMRVGGPSGPIAAEVAPKLPSPTDLGAGF